MIAGLRCSTCWTFLGEALAASDEGRKKLIKKVASEYTVGWSLVDEVREYLWQLKPDVLAKHLVGGLTIGEMDWDFAKLQTVSLGAAALDDPEYFVLPPVPNSLFTRDSSCWIFNGVSVNPMYWPAQRRQSYNLAHLPSAGEVVLFDRSWYNRAGVRP